MKRLTAITAITGAAALSLGMLTATPAAAEAPKPPKVRNTTCARQWFCLYEHSYYGGGIAVFPDNSDVRSYSGMIFHNGVALNDNVSSVYNNKNWADFDIREHENFGGIQVAFVPPYTGYETLTFNDMASSHDW